MGLHLGTEANIFEVGLRSIDQNTTGVADVAILIVVQVALELPLVLLFDEPNRRDVGHMLSRSALVDCCRLTTEEWVHPVVGLLLEGKLCVVRFVWWEMVR